MKIVKIVGLVAVVIYFSIAAYGYVRNLMEDNRLAYCEYFQKVAGNFHDRREDLKWRRDTKYLIDTDPESSLPVKELSRLFLLSSVTAETREEAMSSAEEMCVLLDLYREKIFPQ